MEACCLQSFGEDEPCDWHDKCSSTVSNNLRGQTINRISPSKNKFVAYDEFTASDHGGGAKSGKSKSDKSSGVSCCLMHRLFRCGHDMNQPPFCCKTTTNQQSVHVVIHIPSNIGKSRESHAAYML